MIDSSTVAYESFSNIQVAGNDHRIQNNKYLVSSQANKPLASVKIASGATNNCKMAETHMGSVMLGQIRALEAATVTKTVLGALHQINDITKL